MRLGPKLSLLLAGCSLLPVTMVALVTAPGSAKGLRRQLDALHQNTATALANEVAQSLRDKLDLLELVSEAVGFSELDGAALEQALVLVHRQVRGAEVVTLFDARGKALSPPVMFEDAEQVGDGDHEARMQAALEAYARNAPLQEALERGAAVGQPYILPEPGGRLTPRVVLAATVPGRDGERWVLAVEHSLRAVVERFEAFGSGEVSGLAAGGSAFLVDARGRAIAHPEPALVAAQADLSAHPVLSGGDDELVGSFAEVAPLGWRVVVEQRADAALGAIRGLLRATLLWAALGLFAAILLGFTAIRTVTGRVHQYQAVAQAVSKGAFEAKVHLEGKDELTELGTSLNAMIRGLAERERLRKTFSRYVSDAIAARILLETDDLDLKGELVEVTVLFLDIRGFTSLSERHTPAEVVELLNAYFEVVVGAVTRHDGVINKFIGDAVMAVFGVPKAIPDPERRAISAALEIQSEVAAINQRRAKEGREVSGFGIGVNTGPAIAGNLGSAERMEYTVIGDAVNVAQRLQAQAKEGEVMASATTVRRLAREFDLEALAPVKLKGKEHPIQIYRVLARRPTQVQGVGS
jgi:class 3 adenylate cyclase